MVDETVKIRILSAGAPKGGVVVIQEIFGVNAHIRAVTEGYAAAGYDAIAPALKFFGTRING